MTYPYDHVKKIQAYEARIGIVGLGYVGLPLGLSFSEAGFAVTGFDIDPDKVKVLNAGRSYIGQAVQAGFQPSADFGVARDCDALVRESQDDVAKA